MNMKLFFLTLVLLGILSPASRAAYSPVAAAQFPSALNTDRTLGQSQHLLSACVLATTVATSQPPVTSKKKYAAMFSFFLTGGTIAIAIALTCAVYFLQAQQHDQQTRTDATPETNKGADKKVSDRVTERLKTQKDGEIRLGLPTLTAKAENDFAGQNNRLEEKDVVLANLQANMQAAKANLFTLNQQAAKAFSAETQEYMLDRLINTKRVRTQEIENNLQALFAETPLNPTIPVECEILMDVRTIERGIIELDEEIELQLLVNLRARMCLIMFSNETLTLTSLERAALNNTTLRVVTAASRYHSRATSLQPAHAIIASGHVNGIILSKLLTNTQLILNQITPSLQAAASPEQPVTAESDAANDQVTSNIYCIPALIHSVLQLRKQRLTMKA